MDIEASLIAFGFMLAAVLVALYIAETVKLNAPAGA